MGDLNNTSQIIDNGSKYIMSTYGRFPIVLERGEGVYLYDVDGKKYLDMYAGIAVNALGYGHAGLSKALKDQVDKILHVSNYYYTENLIEASKLIIENSIFDKVFFCNSGAEANEGALKLAKKYGKQKSESKNKIISMKQSFHGRTQGALSVTGQEKYQKSFLPLVPNINYAIYNDLNSVEELIDEDTCAVILEVIQGEGGIIVGNDEFLQGVQNLCEKYDALLIVDEVQTGIGRTGTLFAFEGCKLKPDVVTMAKGLGGGVPVGAMAVRGKADVLVPGDHASTFGGNPLVTAAAKVVITELIQNGVMDNVKEVGDYLYSELTKLKEECNCIKEIRGKGMMLGMELTVPALDIEKECIKEGMLIVGAGEKVLRFVPPLIIEKKHVDEAVSILKNILSKY